MHTHRCVRTKFCESTQGVPTPIAASSHQYSISNSRERWPWDAMKHETEMTEDKDGKVETENKRGKERVCNRAEYVGCDYLAMGDKMTREETEV